MNSIDFHSVLIIGTADPNALRKELKVSEVDFMVLNDESIKIVQIRELLHWLNLKPMNSGKKLAVIENAENMEIESANTLLKTLEEPPSYAQIILTTVNENRILPTIQSRCRKIRLNQEISKNAPDGYFSPEALAAFTVKEKFDWANKTSEKSSSEIMQILTLWQVYYREKMLNNQHFQASDMKILKDLRRAKDLLETNISVKLLLENLLLLM